MMSINRARRLGHTVRELRRKAFNLERPTAEPRESIHQESLELKEAKARAEKATNEEAEEWLKRAEKSRWGKDLIKGPKTISKIKVMLDQYSTGDSTPMSPAEKIELKLLLLCYHDRVCIDTDDLPLATGVEPFTINTGNNPPAKVKPRPVPFAAREFLRKEIETLLSVGAIREVSISEYGAPIRMVIKPDGSWRVCLDYRWLNMITIIPQYPMPRIEDMIAGIRGKRYIASIDLTKAYWQMPVKQEDQKKTAIVSEFGNFEWLRVPMGIAGAVAYFQGTVRHILGSIQCDRKSQLADNYVDDVVLGADTFENFLDIVQKFMSKLREHTMAISMKKSTWGACEVEYLGFRVSAENWYPSPKRVKALLERSPPKDLRELRGFIASCAFYLRFIPGAQTELEPLLEGLRGLEKDFAKRRRNSPQITLSEEAKDAFYKVQELLRKKIMLWHVDPAKTFYLFVDASDKASGSVLMQYKGRDLRPIAFHSQVFNSAQRRYCASERELLGVMHALKKYRTILYKGADVHVYTDHKSILALMTAKGESTARLERWRDDLQNYNLKWHHIAGKDTGAADYLSRPSKDIYDQYADIVENVDAEVEVDSYSLEDLRGGRMLQVRIHKIQNENMAVIEDEKTTDTMALYVTHSKVIEAQKKDPEIKKLIDLVKLQKETKTNERDKRDPEYIYARKCRLYDGILLVASPIPGVDWVPVLPEEFRDEVIRTAHGSPNGHLRNPRLAALIASKCGWPNMYRDIKKYLDTCEVCVTNKPARNYQPPPGAFLAQTKMEQVTIDVMKMSEKVEGMDRILAVIDTAKRFAWAIAIPDETAETQTHALMTHVCNVSTPTMIIADRHPVYESAKFLNWAVQQGIEVNLSAGYSPNHVAVVNRLHSTLRTMIAKSAGLEGMNWVRILPYVVRAYNDTVHPLTGYTPGELMLSAKTRGIIDALVGCKLVVAAADMEEEIVRGERAYKLAQEIAVARIEGNWRKMKEKFQDNCTRGSRDTVAVGTEVMRTSEADRRANGKDVARKYFGPYKVTKVEEDGVHCWIEKLGEFGVGETAPERVKIKILAPTRKLTPMPSYPNVDGRNRNPKPVLKKPIYEKIEPPKHKYETRAKTGGSGKK